jgi:hypothetical protein
MRKGFEFSASTPRDSNTGSRGQAQQLPTSQSSPSRCKSASRPSPTAREPKGPQPKSSGHKSPAYLQGKNPYGEILDRVEHHYTDSEPAAAGPPSQLGSSIEGRSRTFGSIKFTGRPMQPETKRTVAAPTAQPALLSTRHAPKPVSVKAAKALFESKASQGETAPPFPPTASSVIAKGVTANPVTKDPQPQFTTMQRAKDEGTHPTRIPSPSNEPTPTRKYSDPTLPIPHPAQEAIRRVDASQRTNPFSRQQPNLVVIPVTAPKDAAKPKSSSAFEERSREQKTASCHRPTNVFEDESSRVAKPLIYQRPENLSRVQLSEEFERRQSTRKLLTAIEADDTIVSEYPQRSDQTQSSQADRDIRKASSRRGGSSTGSESILTPQSDSSKVARRRDESRSAPLAQREPVDISERQSRRISANSNTEDLDQDIRSLVHNFGEPIDSNKKLDDIAAKNLSHDGSSSPHSFSRRVSAPGAILTTEPVVDQSYDTNRVPYYVESRSGYGRRKTKDFGFPGARIKPSGRSRTYQLLQDPGSWIKRSCGHFSNVDVKESRDDASLQPCRQCRAKHSPPPETPRTHNKERRRASTDSSVAGSSSSKTDHGACCLPSRRRQHHSECMPSDRCGNTFAKDLGTIIDAILEEHTNSLDRVISNIRSSQPRLEHLRRISDDLIHRNRSGDPGSKPCSSVCRYSREHPTSCLHSNHQQIYRPICQPVYQHVYLPVCQPVCQQVCQPSSQTFCKYIPPCPYVPPNQVEKLNVGKPGQVGPNLNDSPESLRETTKSMPELIDLVNSAADDLGVDLDKKLSTQEEEKFISAPVAGTPQQSVSSRSSISLETVVEELQFPSEDSWLQRTQTRFTELSEARSQLMDELDLIARDIGVQTPPKSVKESVSEETSEGTISREEVDASAEIEPVEKRVSIEIDPFQRVLSKVSMALTRQSTRLRNRSVDSITQEIPKTDDEEINERRLSRVLTRILTQSQHVSAITQGREDDVYIHPVEIQQWLEVAQTELPAAIDSITTVLDTLPSVEPVTELEYESEISYDQQPELECEWEGYQPPARTYTGPIIELQDRVADLERQSRKEFTLKEEEFEEEIPLFEYEPSTEPMLRKATTRQPTIKIPSPESIVERVVTRQPTEHFNSPEPVWTRVTTRKPIEPLSSPEPFFERALSRQPTQRSPSLDPVIRRVTARKTTGRFPSPEPEPFFVQRAVTRLPTEQLPSPELVMQEPTTYLPNEPSFDEPPVPPSTPSSLPKEDILLPSHEDTEQEEAVVEDDQTFDRFGVSRMAEAPSRTATFERARTQSMLLVEPVTIEEPYESELIEPEIKRQYTRAMAMPRQQSLRRQSTQPEAIYLPESAVSSPWSPSSILEENASVELPISPARSTSPAPFERSGVVPLVMKMRQTTTYEPKAEVLDEQLHERQPTEPRRRSTIAERAATFEERASLPSRQKEVDGITIPISQQPSRRRTDLEESAILKRHATRQPTIIEKAPTRVSTGFTYEQTQASDKLVEEPEIIQGNIVRESSMHEEGPVLERQPTRQPTIVSRRATKLLTEQVENPGVMEGQFTRQATPPPELEPSLSQASSPLPFEGPLVWQATTRRPTRRQREPSIVEAEQSPPRSRVPTHQSTQIERMTTQLDVEPEVESPESANTRVPSELFAPSRRTTERHPTILERKATSVERQPNSPPEVAEVVLEISQERELSPESTPAPSEHDFQPVIRKQATLNTESKPGIPSRAKTFKPPVMPMARQETQHEELKSMVDLSSTGSEGEAVKMNPVNPTELAPARHDSSPLVDHDILEVLEEDPAYKEPSQAPSRWSTQAVKNDHVADAEPEALRDAISDYNRQTSIIPRKPTAISRKATVLSRQLTARDRIPSPEPEPEPEHISRMPTRAPTRQERVSDRRPSIMNEMIQSAESLVTVQQRPLAIYDPPAVPFEKLTMPAPERQATAPTDAGDSATEIPLQIETYERHVERQPNVPAEEALEQGPSRVIRLPTADLSRDPESLGPPRVVTATSYPRERKASSPPRIVVPPIQVLGSDLKPTAPSHKRRKGAPVPPYQQYPPAPAYPSRNTPVWTKPNAREPSSRPIVEPIPKEKKRARLVWGSEPKEKARSPLPKVEHGGSMPQIRPPKRDKLFGPFRRAAPGKCCSSPDYLLCSLI